MIKIENRFFFILAFLMALVVSLSNYLVQFPVNYYGFQDLLTYGAFSYPIAFLMVIKIQGNSVYFGQVSNGKWFL